MPSAESWIIGEWLSTNINASLTQNRPLNGRYHIDVSHSEANYEDSVADAGAFTRAWVDVTLHQPTSNSFFAFRVNRSDSALVVTIVASTTGEFENLTDTASVTATDEVNWQIRTGTPNFTNCREFSVQYEPDDLTKCTTFARVGASTFGTVMSSPARTVGMHGTFSALADADSNRDRHKTIIGSSLSYTWKRMRIRITVNGSTGGDIRSHIDGGGGWAAGNQVATIPSMTTGSFEDLTNSDALVGDDEIACRYVGENVTVYGVSSKLTNAVGLFVPHHNGGSATFTDGLTRYRPIEGSANASNPSNIYTYKPPFTMTISGHVIWFLSNTFANPFDVDYRKNDVIELQITIPGSTAGQLSVSGTVSIGTGDQWSWHYDASTTGGGTANAYWWYPLDSVQGPDPPDDPEVVFPPDEVLDGTTVGLTWAHFIDQGGTNNVYSTIELPDPASYFEGFKTGDVIAWRNIVRALSDWRGQHEGLAFGWLMKDTPDPTTGIRKIRKLLSEHATRYFRGRESILRTISDEDRRALQNPRVLARGIIDNYEPTSDFRFSFTGVDEFSQKFGRNADKRQVPSRTTTLTDFDDCPDANLDLAVPMLYGNMSDVTGSAVSLPGPATTTVIGLASSIAKPTSPMAVALAEANLGHHRNQFYCVSAIVGGAEGKLSDTVEIDNRDSSNKSNRITWVAVSGATTYYVYRSHRTDFGQLSAMDVGNVVTWDDNFIGVTERNPSIPSPHDHNQQSSSWRMEVRYKVYAKFADGTFSRGGPETAMNNTDGEISKGKSAFTVMQHQHEWDGFQRQCRITWAAVTDAVEYHVFRKCSVYHWFRPFQKPVIVPATQTTLDDTLEVNFGKASTNSDYVTLPDEVTTTDTPGQVPCIHVGTEQISGKTWQRFLVAGHACKAITSIYYEVDAENDPHADPNIEPPREFRQAVKFGTGEEWLAPQETGWPHANSYLDINGRRYQLIYTTIHPVPKLVTVNVLGVENIGDGTGTLITSIFEQYRHLLDNWIINSYDTGLWVTTPPTFSDGTRRLDTVSFGAVKTESETRIPGGYLGAFAFGSEGDFLTVNQVFARLNISGDVDSGWNRRGQFMLSMFTPTALITGPTFDDVRDIIKGTFKVRDMVDEMFNVVPYAFGRNYGIGEWAIEDELSDAAAIAASNTTARAPRFDFWATRSATQVADIIGRKLARFKEPPRIVTMSTWLQGLDVELGDLVRIDHPEGIGAQGWSGNPMRVTRHEVDPNDFTVTLEGWDVETLFRGAFILGDETVLATPWDSATVDEQRYGYLCDETDGLFSNNIDPGKRL